MNDRVRAVREAVSIYDVLAERGIVVSRSAPQKVHCPVHDDRHKSAVVYPESEEVFCFAEGRTYDVVSLVMEWEALEWYAACAWLEERVGIVYERRANPQDEFWRLASGKARRLSPKQSFDLRWAIHRSVLDLCDDRAEVDWSGFDLAVGLDPGILYEWQKEVLKNVEVIGLDGGGSEALGRDPGDGVAAGVG